jgi:omega-amidase
MSKSDLFLEPVALNLVWKDPQANVKAMRAEIAQRLQKSPEVSSQDRIFVFPELTLTGFVTTDPGSSALHREDQAIQSVHDLAKEFKTAIVFGFPERQEGPRAHVPWNTLIFVDPSGEELADYQKIHLFTAGSPSEHTTYEAGTSGVIVEYRGWKIAFGICFDLRFPPLFSEYAKEGADLVILPACWVGGAGKSHQLQTLSAAHAIAGQYYFLSVNRSGEDPNFKFEGETLVYSPKGELLKGEAPFRISDSVLQEARKLSVRPSDRPDYLVLKGGS